MILFKIHLLLFLSSLLLFSCENEEKLNFPISQFSQPFPKRSINFENVVGTTFSIVCGSDTVTYSVSFDRKSRLNHLTEISNYDTTSYQIEINRFRDLYFLNFKTNDSLWWISAIQIKDSTVFGLGSIEEQVLNQMFKTDSLILKNKHLALLQTKSKDEILLKTEKKEIYHLYKEILQSEQPCRIIKQNMDSKNIEEEESTEVLFEDKTEDESLIIYPNPANEILNIKTDVKNCFLAIKDSNEDVKMTTQISNEELRLDITSLKVGTYYVVLADPRNARKITKRFVVQR